MSLSLDTERPDFKPSFHIAETCESYSEYLLKFEVAGLDECIRYDEKMFTNVKHFIDLYKQYLPTK